MVMAPTPSANASRASRRTTCSARNCNSATSSTVMMRSLGCTSPHNALSNVVLPLEAAPVTTMLQRAATMWRNIATAESLPKECNDRLLTLKRRIERHGPSTAMGGMTAHIREPSAKRASTMGEDRSIRLPSGSKMRSMIASSSPAGSISTRRTPLLSSTNTSLPALTITSRTDGSARNCSKRPTPVISAMARWATCSRASLGSNGAMERR